MPGIEVQKGLAAIGDDPGKFQTLLVRFYRSNLDIAEKLDGFLDGNDRQGAVRLIHSIKGVAGTLGAGPLHLAAADLEAGLRQGIDPRPQGRIKTFKAELEVVLAGIRPLVPGPETEVSRKSPGNTGGDQDLALLLHDLLPHVKRRKPKPARAVMAGIKQRTWPTEFQGLLDDIAAAMDAYQFRDATTLTEHLLNKLA